MKEVYDAVDSGEISIFNPPPLSKETRDYTEQNGYPKTDLSEQDRKTIHQWAEAVIKAEETA